MTSSQLKKIAAKLLSDPIHSEDNTATLAEYKELLLNATSLDLNSKEHDVNIQLENGIAIGLNSAASCLHDSLRTQKFIRGAKLAIDQKLKVGQNPVHLLYAGTGPFATLILPLLSHFSPKQLQVTLIDINPVSVKNVTEVITHFGFDDHIVEISCADASTIVLDRLNVDILLSETMQHALQTELQLVICANLLNQLPNEVILIPQSIDLSLVILDLKSNNPNPKEIVGELMKVDKDFLRIQYPIDANWSFEKRFKVSKSTNDSTKILAISTAIQVYGNEQIEWNESGLTVPKYIEPINGLFDHDCIVLKYTIVPEPGFQLLIPSSNAIL